MREAAQIAEIAMQTAWDGVRPGVRQCDLMADVVAAQIRGTKQFGGDQPALHPLILAGEAASTAHPMWNDSILEEANGSIRAGVPSVIMLLKRSTSQHHQRA